MHTWYMHVIQRDFDVNFNNPFLFFLTTYVISSYNKYHNHIRKKKKKNSISIILFTLTTPITRCPINHIDFLSSTICIKMNNGKKRS